MSTISHVPPKAMENPTARRPARQTNPWLRFGLRRLGGLVLSFVVLTLVTFLIVPLIPGDPAVVAAGEGATGEQIEAMRQALGLELPLVQQFWNYFSGVLSGDLGTSFVSGEAVSTVIFSRFPFTAEIAVLSIILVLLLAVPLGMLVAIATRNGRNAWLDHGFNAVTGLVYSIPQYVLGTFLVLIFAVGLKWFPAAGAATLNAMVLPTAALMFGPACVISRIVRRETAVVMEQDYVRTARGWRLPPLRTYLRYVLPNLVTTTLTLSGLILAAQLGGAIVIETVFSWPGLGQGIVNAILQRDYPVIRGIILILGLLATAIIILVDVILAVIDPRNLGGSHDA